MASSPEHTLPMSGRHTHRVMTAMNEARSQGSHEIAMAVHEKPVSTCPKEGRRSDVHIAWWHAQWLTWLGLENHVLKDGLCCRCLRARRGLR